MTLPWDDNGYRVLPSAAYMDHTEKMRELSNRFTPAVDALAREFGNLVEQAKVRLGGLFRPEDCPAPDELRSKFPQTKQQTLPSILFSAEQRGQEHEWSIAAEQALRSAKACGHDPVGVERPLTESRQSQQDWRAILRDFVAATAPSDCRWMPPNRRFVASGLYLPSVERRGLGEIVIAVDTSGSIGKLELEQFAGEISAISEEAQPEAIHVVYCDAAVQSTQEFTASEPARLEPRGGGGTDFRPVFEWVAKNDIAPVCLIYLTDLCCHSFPETREYRVLWVTDSRRTAPFGETVRIGLE
jgi:predicted metal-dependent peptidase